MVHEFKSSPGILRTKELTPSYRQALISAGLTGEDSLVLAAAVARHDAEDIPPNQIEKTLIQEFLYLVIQSGLWRSDLLDEHKKAF